MSADLPSIAASTMSNPLLSIIIPTHNRPHLLPRAVRSALGQTFTDLEVVVVDDASKELVQAADLTDDSRLRVIRLDSSHGASGARNIGVRAARGRWVMFLDDDDCILPHLAAVSFDAIAASTLPPPLGVLTAIQKVSAQGEVLKLRIPPTLCPRGGHFFLEDPEPGRSYLTKQTLVVERDVMLQIGGFDEQFRSRVYTELFLRLNPVCTLIGLPIVTYQLWNHSGARISGTPELRQKSFHRLIQKHWATFQAHPRQFAVFVYEHACTSYRQKQYGAALWALAWSVKIHPAHMAARLVREAGWFLGQFRRTVQVD